MKEDRWHDASGRAACEPHHDWAQGQGYPVKHSDRLSASLPRTDEEQREMPGSPDHAMEPSRNQWMHTLDQCGHSDTLPAELLDGATQPEQKPDVDRRCGDGKYQGGSLERVTASTPTR